MAVVPMANRMVPSSRFNLISLSPHAAVSSPPSVHRIPKALRSVSQWLFQAHQVQTTILRYFPRFGPTALADSALRLIKIQQCRGYDVGPGFTFLTTSRALSRPIASLTNSRKITESVVIFSTLPLNT